VIVVRRVALICKWSFDTANAVGVKAVQVVVVEPYVGVGSDVDGIRMIVGTVVIGVGSALAHEIRGVDGCGSSGLSGTGVRSVIGGVTPQ
jgi:hypothetical protein